ncbi:peptidoglycan-binding protein [Cereibacter changlensis JA139]|uniref:Peptidoglycan-binding protein n=2 Tax=Cereibacter changlensis TaxID=402884 RepID=A0A2T4JU54_9RHOB|nr:serine protease [Cereibacter changlensis]PTE21293.1 peptidoglycan-binding protein [Cereibacter changlensis JA139]PZX53572.1 putative peptidoglycan binding protein [Cereibacter changlensis]
MRQAIFLLGLLTALVFGAAAMAQDRVWVQIEAQPTLREGEERARAYAGAFPDVSGFQMTSGWYAILLGPYGPDVARLRLDSLRAERLIPSDSFIADGRNFRQQFWPAGQLGAPLPPPVAITPLDDIPSLMQPDPQPDLAQPQPLFDETPAEARASESLLTLAERQDLQRALQWFGFYAAGIDGAFGAGTRTSMAAWQEANAQQPTGILTTAQRRSLMQGYESAQAELGLETITEAEAGIEITLPTALVAFERYEPPFVRYAEKDGSGVRVILISEPGDQATLYGLYDMLQTLEAVPLDGARERRETSFTIEGRSADLASHTHVELAQGMVKGFMLIWNPDDDERIARVLTAMQSSFRPIGDRALDPGMVMMDAAQRGGLTTGLEVRRPALSRSGFYIDAQGSVLTTVEALQSCRRITLDRDTEAEVAFRDDTLGIAVLRPRQPLAPQSYASFQGAALRPGSEIAVAGYSYEDQLPAPTLTFGALDGATGLNGEPDLRRLTLTALPGDAGGPVLSTSGAVLGMLLPKAEGGARQLPAEVGFAAAADALAARLAQEGLSPRNATPTGALAPEDLTRLGMGMTVLVSCWQ